MPEVPKHTRAHRDDYTHDYPEVVRQADDGIRGRVDVEYCHEEGEGKREEGHDGKDAHSFVLFCGEKRVVGLTQLMQRFGFAHDVIVYAEILARKRSQIRDEIGAEETPPHFLEGLQDVAVRLYLLAQIHKVACTARESRDHRHFLTGKGVLFDGEEVVADVLHFVLHGLVELFEHVIKKKSGMIAEVAFLEKRVDLQYLRKIVQRVYGVVVDGDEEFVSEYEVYFLFAGLV